MGSTKEKFHLRWNDFDANLSSAFRNLREQSDFFDVTLACDGERQIEAHKVIIAACSPVFRNILKRNPHRNQLIYLKGVKYQELVAILNFMYHGEVDVAQDRLNSFLAVAEELAVKGLTQAEAPTTTTTPPATSKQTSKRQKVAAAGDIREDEGEIEEVEEKRRRKSIKSDPITFETSTPTGAGDTCSPTGGDEEDMQTAYADFEGGYDDTDYDGSASFDPSSSMSTSGVGGPESKDVDDLCSKLFNYATDENGTSIKVCTVCGKTSKSRKDMVRHIEASHVENTEVVCQYCSQVVKNRNALKCHIWRKHKSEKRVKLLPS